MDLMDEELRRVLAGSVEPAAPESEFANEMRRLRARDAARPPTASELETASRPSFRTSSPGRRTQRGGGEALETIGSAVLGSIPAGLTGLGYLVTGQGPQKAAEAVQRVQDYLTLEPQTEGGIRAVRGIAEGLSPLGAIPQAAGEATLRATGSPLLATGAELLADPLNLLGAGAAARPAARAAAAAGRGAAKAGKATVQSLGPKAAEMAESYMRRAGMTPEITVYHGSPHVFAPEEGAPLGRFRSEKIGTGEGAQAYGVGTYTAEAPEVAKTYISAGGVKPTSSPDIYAADLVGMMGGEEKAIKHLRHVMPEAGQTTFSGESKDLIESVIKAIESGSYKKSAGNLYAVDLPDPMIEKMLDWDKPLSQQSQDIQKAAQRIAANLDPDARKLVGDSLMSLKGSKLYELLASDDSVAGAGRFGAAASSIMREHGIPGIKYLDEQSRAAGQGTRNFVVFPGEEKNLTILQRNEQRLPQAAPPKAPSSPQARADVQAQARALGLPATGSTDKMARLVSIAQSNPSKWTKDDFDLIAPHLSVHQDLRPGAQERIDSILSEGLSKGMVDSVGDMASGQRWTWGKGLQGTPAYVFISGDLKYQGQGNPRLAPGNKPLFAIEPGKGQNFYEALQTARQSQKQAQSKEQRLPQTDTPAFKEFTGGAPLVMPEQVGAYKFETGKPVALKGYHGTAGDFKTFGGTKNIASGLGGTQDAFFFTPTAGRAADFAEMSGDATYDIATGVRMGGENVMPVYLSMKNPLVVNKLVEDTEEIFEIINKAQAGGHDGVIMPRTYDYSIYHSGEHDETVPVFVAFRPEQIKSAIGNRGTFDAKSPDITKAQGGPVGGNMSYTQAADVIANKLVGQGVDPDRAMTMALRMSDAHMKAGGAVMMNQGGSPDSFQYTAEESEASDRDMRKYLAEQEIANRLQEKEDRYRRELEGKAQESAANAALAQRFVEQSLSKGAPAATRMRRSWSGPMPNRPVVNGRKMVSAEELADFRRQFGEKMTLRDLLNADRGMGPSATNPAARGQRRAEAPAATTVRSDPYQDPSRVLEGVAASQRAIAAQPGRDAVEGAYPETALVPMRGVMQVARALLAAKPRQEPSMVVEAMRRADLDAVMAGKQPPFYREMQNLTPPGATPPPFRMPPEAPPGALVKLPDGSVRRVPDPNALRRYEPLDVYQRAREVAVDPRVRALEEYFEPTFAEGGKAKPLVGIAPALRGAARTEARLAAKKAAEDAAKAARTPTEKAVVEKFGQKQEQEAARAKKVEQLSAEAPQREVKPAGRRVKVQPDVYRKMAEQQGEEAVLRAARAGEHLKPTPQGYVGAPRTVTSPQGLGAMRRAMDKDFNDAVEAVRLADPQRLGTWYDRAKQGIAESSEPYQLPRVLEQHGVYSAGVSPESELGFSLKHLNTRAMGEPGMAYRGDPMRNLDEAVEQNRPANMGFKIGEYMNKNDPRLPNAGLFGVNDFRRAQGMGYTDPAGNPWKAGVSETMHPFMDLETALQVDRANRGAVGGRTDWAGPHIQEVPWVYGKAQDLYSRGKSGRFGGDELEGIKRSLVEANNTARDYMYKHAASATHEAVPGASLGHVRQVLDMTPEQKAAYGATGRWDLAAPEMALSDMPGVGAGPRDVMYGALGLRQLPSRQGSGLYINSLGDVETNPMTIARPLMDFPTGGGGLMAPLSRKTMEATEGLRALLDAQEAGAFNLPNTMSGVKNKTSMVLDTRGRNPDRLGDPSAGVLPTSEQLAKMNDELARLQNRRMDVGPIRDPGFGVSSTNRGAVVFPYKQDMDPSEAARALKDVKKALTDIFPADAQMSLSTMGYVPGVGKRGEFGPEPTAPFSGEATIDKLLMLADLPQEVARSLGESEAIRAQIREKALRDAKLGGTRRDIQETRRFFSEADWPKAIEMIRNGMTPAAALAALGYSASAMAEQAP